jgi:glycosyltransferase involved in cell wall biosynthesis
VTELIQDGTTGYLVGSGDSEALAQRITFALRNGSTRSRIAALGRKFVMDSFGMEKMVGAVENLYDELIERTRNDQSNR